MPSLPQAGDGDATSMFNSGGLRLGLRAVHGGGARTRPRFASRPWSSSDARTHSPGIGPMPITLDDGKLAGLRHGPVFRSHMKARAFPEECPEGRLNESG